MTETKKYLKYFEIPLGEAKEWGWKEYVLFILEICWTTIFPFIGGVLLVARTELIWLLMLALPIYFRLKIEKRVEKDKPKLQRIYVR